MKEIWNYSGGCRRRKKNEIFSSASCSSRPHLYSTGASRHPITFQEGVFFSHPKVVGLTYEAAPSSLFAFWCLSRDAVWIELTRLKGVFLFPAAQPQQHLKTSNFSSLFPFFPLRSGATQRKKGKKWRKRAVF